ncbi:hypothetical protein [Coraliomargarita parva]|uniref:hypothetical protein n=1 Tax=Coraliomargarita parva TaxID=3014050 RepID=UPI0022B460F8|nr:hypothetical protein [Coraliomargarita parva]
MFKPIALLLLVLLMCSCSQERKRSMSLDLPSGDMVQLILLENHLVVLSEDKPIVRITVAKDRYFLETFGAGVPSITTEYRKWDFEPKRMSSMRGPLDDPLILLYGEDGYVKKETRVNAVLEDL